MRIVRFRYQGIEHWGIAGENKITFLKDFAYHSIKPLKKTIPLAKAKLLPPATPTKIILVGLNYREHARELSMAIPREPILFLKPLTALIGHKDSIRYPKGVSQLDYEAELAVVIKKTARHIQPKMARDYILGYTCLNDVTARDLQRKDGQWTRAKSFDTFCPLGPWCETDLDVTNIAIQAYLNGQLKQDSSTSQFIFSIDYLVSFISKVMTLLPGDVISSGTPAGVGKMNQSDTAEIRIEGIGSLINKVV